jgi:hypothetical protein
MGIKKRYFCFFLGKEKIRKKTHPLFRIAVNFILFLSWRWHFWRTSSIVMDVVLMVWVWLLLRAYNHFGGVIFYFFFFGLCAFLMYWLVINIMLVDIFLIFPLPFTFVTLPILFYAGFGGSQSLYSNDRGLCESMHLADMCKGAL